MWGQEQVKQQVPNIVSSSAVMSGQADVSGIIKYLILGLIIFGTIGMIFYILLENRKRREMQRSEEKFWKNMK